MIESVIEKLIIQFLRFVGVLVISFGIAGPAIAGTVTTEVDGYFNRSQENECLHIGKFYYLADCAYMDTKKQIRGNELTWVGPISNAVYFKVGSKLADPYYVPQPGDDRYRPPMTGSISIDDKGTDDPADDVISGTLVVGAAARSLITNIPEVRPVINDVENAQPRAVQTWKSITHTLAPRVANQVTGNEHGGLDYVIGAKGFPSMICMTEHANDCFPAEYARKIETGPKAKGDWSASGSAPIVGADALGGNVGTSTTAVVDGADCTDNTDGEACTKDSAVWGSDTEDFDLDNVILKVATDSSGKVLSLQAFWTIETRLNVGPPAFQPPAPQANSWNGGYMEAVAVSATK